MGTPRLRARRLHEEIQRGRLASSLRQCAAPLAHGSHPDFRCILPPFFRRPPPLSPSIPPRPHTQISAVRASAVIIISCRTRAVEFTEERSDPRRDIPQSFSLFLPSRPAVTKQDVVHQHAYQGAPATPAKRQTFTPRASLVPPAHTPFSAYVSRGHKRRAPASIPRSGASFERSDPRRDSALHQDTIQLPPRLLTSHSRLAS